MVEVGLKRGKETVSDKEKGHESGSKQPITLSRDKSQIPRLPEHIVLTRSRGSGMSKIVMGEDGVIFTKAPPLDRSDRSPIKAEKDWR